MPHGLIRKYESASNKSHRYFHATDSVCCSLLCVIMVEMSIVGNVCLTALDKVNIHTAIECTGLEAKATTLRNVRQVAVTALPQLNHRHRKQL